MAEIPSHTPAMDDLERRGFLKQALFAALAAGLSGSATASPIRNQSRVPPAQGPLRSTRVLNSTHTRGDQREESTMDIEIVPADGSKVVTKNYYKRVEGDGAYDVLISTLILWYDTAASESPVRQSTKTISLSATKGEVRGDTRMDSVTTTLVQDGAMIRTGPVLMPMAMQNPYEGMSQDDMVCALLHDKFK